MSDNCSLGDEPDVGDGDTRTLAQDLDCVAHRGARRAAAARRYGATMTARKAQELRVPGPRVAACLLAAALVAATSCSTSTSPSTGAGPTAATAAPGTTAGTTSMSARFVPDHVTLDVRYPPQPSDVAWPTAGWTEGPLPPEADAAQVQATLDKAFGELSTGPNQQFDAALVVHRGRIVVERYRPGFGDRHTIHRSWSMAKSFTQALVGILVRDGKLDVRAPAPVAGWSNPEDPRHAITTDQLLRMASGLEWKEEYFAPDSDTLAMLGGVGKQDMAAYAASKSLEVPPGSRVRYSTGSTCIASGIVGSVVGHGDAYRTFIQRELLDPMGIPPGEVAPGFDGAGNLIGGSVFDTTARNYAKLGLLYLRDGTWDGTRIEPEGWVDYARTPTPAPAGLPTYGAGWWLKASDPSRFEAGGFGGQHIVVVPKKDLVVVLLSDRLDGKDGAIRDDLVDAFANLPDAGTATPRAGTTASPTR